MTVAIVGGMGLWVSRQMARYDHTRKLADAALHNDTRQMLALVQAGADPNAPLASGPDPSFLAILQQALHPPPPLDPHIPNAFVTACGLRSQLMENGQLTKVQCPEDTALLQAMVARGANLRWQSRDNQTPLSLAVSVNYLRAAQLLLDKGADVNTPDTNGDTPLIRAVTRGERDMAGVLLAHGANVNAQNAAGQTALHSTLIFNRNRDIIQQLMAHGADPGLANKRGQTPIALAQRTNRPDLVSLLMPSAK